MTPILPVRMTPILPVTTRMRKREEKEAGNGASANGDTTGKTHIRPRPLVSITALAGTNVQI